MNARPQRLLPNFCSIILFLMATFALLTTVNAQSEVTGAFQGNVTDGQKPIPNAVVKFINLDTQVPAAKRTDSQGQFYQGNLYPGRYVIEVSAQGYRTKKVAMSLPTMKSTVVIPVPVTLEIEAVATTPPAGTTPQPEVKPQPVNQQQILTASEGTIRESIDINANLNAADARRSGTFTQDEVAALPLGGATITRSFDELALLLPGVALSPQTQGGIAGPGVGPGVGSAGQFAVNGLRSRANNFTVDGSDNNDEDIGVRRQGFFTLVPQSIESIREYQITTALAPAQYGRNLGAQVNAVSRSGGYQGHGDFYGFLNTSKLNKRDFFDTLSNGAPTRLQGIVRDTDEVRDVFVNGVRRDAINPAAGKDSLTFGQAGFAFGGPLLSKPAVGEAAKSAFYFFSFEGQLLNANREKSFAVPTVEERGLNDSGAAGICRSGLVTGVCAENDPRAYPTNLQGDAIFSLFPLPNNPGGIYGRNTFTQILPASAQGNIASVKMEHNFKLKERAQSLTGRYNRTSDWRNIPAAGGAIFATLRPVVRTDNISLFLNSELSGPGAINPLSNQFRASYGRTRLLFEEERDMDNLIPSRLQPNEPFMLNARVLENLTLPNRNRDVVYAFANRDTEANLGPIGQLQIAGFSPLGVDVFNFPQRRVNNTYQLADTLTLRVSNHSFAFGGDFRRTDLNSALPRNARTLVAFNSSTTVGLDNSGNLLFDSAGNNAFRRFVSPANRAAAAAPSNVSQTLALITSQIGLRYYQLNFFAQDEWRIRPNLSLSYGLRYEYNTPPREVNNLIEGTFRDQRLGQLPGLQTFLKNREQIFDPDRNNFGPRVGLAYSRNIFGTNTTVFRLGYGLFYDQALGAVVSQSRNVFPNFLTLNSGSGLPEFSPQGAVLPTRRYNIFNPSRGFLGGIPLVAPGTLNQLDPRLQLADVVNAFNGVFPEGFGFTLPDKDFPLPMAHQYAFTIEQQLGANATLSLAYVGTRGENLLRLTTPNLGPNVLQPSVFFEVDGLLPFTRGYRLNPGQSLRLNPASPTDRTQLLVSGGRPVSGIGTIHLYQTNAESRYDSLQAQLDGRLGNSLRARIAYTFAKAIDDVSDAFDLAGASALPQNNTRLGNERGPANFDVRHRVAISFVYVLPTLFNRNSAARLLLGGFELAGTSQYQTGQPFTINSLFDINSDGNYTDRLNTADGLIIAQGNNRNPVQKGPGFNRENINSTLSILALCDLSTPGGVIRVLCGKDGAVGRNTFRAGDYFLANLALTKNFAINERHRIIFRTEAFNIFNRANFGIPVRFLEAPAFGEAVDTVTPGRRIQFALKYSF